MLFYCTLSILALILVALFCSAIWRNSLSFVRFAFRNHQLVFSCENSRICHLKNPIFFFFPYLFPRFCCCIICPCVASDITSSCYLFFSALFYVTLVLTHPHNLQCSWVLFIFLIHIVCPCHLSDLMSSALSSTYLLSCSFVWHPSLFI